MIQIAGVPLQQNENLPLDLIEKNDFATDAGCTHSFFLFFCGGIMV